MSDYKAMIESNFDDSLHESHLMTPLPTTYGGHADHMRDARYLGGKPNDPIGLESHRNRQRTVENRAALIIHRMTFSVESIPFARSIRLRALDHPQPANSDRALFRRGDHE